MYAITMNFKIENQVIISLNYKINYLIYWKELGINSSPSLFIKTVIEVASFLFFFLSPYLFFSFSFLHFSLFFSSFTSFNLIFQYLLDLKFIFINCFGLLFLNFLQSQINILIFDLYLILQAFIICYRIIK